LQCVKTIVAHKKFFVVKDEFELAAANAFAFVRENYLNKNGQSPVRGLYNYGLRHTTTNTTHTHVSLCSDVINILLYL
jgi:hypothetical protein